MDVPVVRPMVMRHSYSPFFAIPFAAAVAAGLAVAGCSSSSASAPASLRGSVDGETFNVGSALGWSGWASPCTGASGPCTPSGQAVSLLIANRSDLTCALGAPASGPAAHLPYANLESLQIVAVNGTGDVAPGTYDLGGLNGFGQLPVGTAVYASLGSTSPTCAPGQFFEASGGTVTLTEVSATHVTGSFDVTFAPAGSLQGSAGTLTGSFDIPICDGVDADSALFYDGGTPVCTQ